MGSRPWNLLQPSAYQLRSSSRSSGWTGTTFSTSVFVLFSVLFRLLMAVPTCSRQSGSAVVSRSRQRRAATSPGRIPVRRSSAYITRRSSPIRSSWMSCQTSPGSRPPWLRFPPFLSRFAGRSRFGRQVQGFTWMWSTSTASCRSRFTVPATWWTYRGDSSSPVFSVRREGRERTHSSMRARVSSASGMAPRSGKAW
ncbi:hypothetical protein [Anaeromyxobacter dehalogenans]|uniref:hypothetical protein n=1 Tax=Anaeromyxobacter dehalogenans TaxID=161493 RepID=UPI00059CC1DD|nr:hypothetical protein [Anaeromyxobacter dehalogenans]